MPKTLQMSQAFVDESLVIPPFSPGIPGTPRAACVQW